MGDGGTYFLVVCDNVSSNVLNALQLAKITSRYTITDRVGLIKSRVH